MDAQLFASINVNNTSSAVCKRGGIVALNTTVGGTVEFIVPIEAELLPYLSDIITSIGKVPPETSIILACFTLRQTNYIINNFKFNNDFLTI